MDSKLGVEGEKTSEIAKNNDAIAAINGGAFTDDPNAQEWTQNGGLPTGILMTDGKVIFDDTIHYKKYETVAITKSGILMVGSYTYDELMKKDISEILTFGPALIVGGRKIRPLVDNIGNAPKTLIGQKGDGTIVLVVLDSANGTRICASLEECQDIMYKLGCVTASNLDGGKSTTMYYKGEVINNPSNPTGERAIASGFIVK